MHSTGPSSTTFSLQKEPLKEPAPEVSTMKTAFTRLNTHTGNLSFLAEIQAGFYTLHIINVLLRITAPQVTTVTFRKHTAFTLSSPQQTKVTRLQTDVGVYLVSQ